LTEDAGDVRAQHGLNSAIVEQDFKSGIVLALIICPGIIVDMRCDNYGVR
jgi:hypothetical protein